MLLPMIFSAESYLCLFSNFQQLEKIKGGQKPVGGTKGVQRKKKSAMKGKGFSRGFI